MLERLWQLSSEKTQPNRDEVVEYLSKIDHQRKREDAFAIMELMQEVTGKKPVLWGTMIGFGRYRYPLANGKTGEAFLTGFAPRKQSLTLYIMSGFDTYDDLLSRLGKYKTGKACLYINKLADVDSGILRSLVRQSFDHMVNTNTVVDE